ncbi:HDIG domain-containing protein [bacterium]|nr:HDIG domain-containing protein [candidate division CSSED10-310 bacterium]
MSREQAITLIRSKVPNRNLINHMIAVGAIMETLASRFQQDPGKWMLTGILHDIDLGETDDPAVHGKLGASWLKEMGMDRDICDAVTAHAGHGTCDTPLSKALIAADQLSGLVVACALVKDRKLDNVTPDTVLKRFKEKRFAAGADRNKIMSCSDLDLTLREFVEISLDAMKTIAPEIGL